MKRFLVVVVFCLFSVKSWSCYYDMSSYVTSCNANYQGQGTALFLKCPFADYKYDAIACVRLDLFPNYTAAQFCATQSTFSLDPYKVCPGGPVPPKTLPKVSPNQTATSCGSIIRTDKQVLSEKITLVDVPFYLSYSSDRVQGRKDWYKTTIPITHKNFYGSNSIVSEDLNISISGQVFSQSFLPSANLKYDFTWDGKDGNGNPVSGSKEAIIAVNEIYNFNSALFPDDGYIVLSPSHYVTPPNHDKKISKVILGTIFDGNTGIDGWDISIRHHYDPIRKILYLGDGNQFNTSSVLRPNGDYWIVSPDRSEIYVFNSNLKHIETKDGLLNLTRFTFNYSSGILVSIQDKYGNETTFEYSSQSLASITSPFGHVTQIATNSNGFIETVTNPASEVHEMTYTNDGLLLTFEKPNGTISTMTYDQNGLLLTDSSSEGSSTTLTREDTENGFKITETSELGRSRVHTINLSNSNYFRGEIQANQSTKNYNMDFSAKSITTSGTGHPSVGNYTKNDSRFPGIVMPDYFSISDGGFKIVTYSENVSLSNSSDPFSFSSFAKTWTSNGKTQSSSYTTSNNTIVNTTPLGKTVTSVLNANGDVTSTQFGGLQSVNYSYGTYGRVDSITQGSRYINLSYHSATGFLSSVENALGQTTSFTYDLAGRVLTQTLSDSRVITYTYDSNGNVASITPAGKPSHSLSYNGFDYLSSYIPPTVQAPNNVTTTYTYSDDRELTHINRPDGQTVELNYGTNGNLDSIDLPTGTRSFGYSSGNLTSSTSEDLFSRYPSYSQSKINVDYISKTGFSYYITNSYNSELLQSGETLNINSVNYPASYSYDNDNLLTVAGAASYVRSTSTGAIEEFSLNFMKQKYSYSSNFGELSSIESEYDSSTTTYEVSYLRDDLGRITQKTEQYAGSSIEIFVYTYDSAGRLTNVTLNGNPFHSFTFDSNSNRTSQTLSGVTTNATYDDQDRLLTFGAKSFTYNMNGEVTSMTDSSTSQTVNYSYDVLGNLKSVTLPSKTVNYKVDAHDRRMAKYNGTTLENYYIWNSSNQLIGITDNTGTLIDRYVYGSRGHVPDYFERGTNKFQIVTNHLGSPVQIINSNTGVIAQEIKYDEWGNITSDTNPGFQPFGFAGCLYDQDTKLCRFGARDYDASIGRWLSKDPILFAGGDTNLYGYVMQDPINFIDTSGLVKVPAGAGPTADFLLTWSDSDQGALAGGAAGLGVLALTGNVPGAIATSFFVSNFVNYKYGTNSLDPSSTYKNIKVLDPSQIPSSIPTLRLLPTNQRSGVCGAEQ